jgi:hypothetical protein
MGIVILSSMGILLSSAKVAAKAPKTAKKGLPNQKIPKTEQLTKQAKLPSKLLFCLIYQRLPKFIPTNAAKVTPIVKKSIAQQAIKAGKKANTTTLPQRAYKLLL